MQTPSYNIPKPLEMRNKADEAATQSRETRRGRLGRRGRRGLLNGKASPPELHGNTENSNAEKIKKRKEALANIIRNTEFPWLTLDPQKHPIAPNPYDLRITKRQWEAAAMEYRHQLLERAKEHKLRSQATGDLMNTVSYTTSKPLEMRDKATEAATQPERVRSEALAGVRVVGELKLVSACALVRASECDCEASPRESHENTESSNAQKSEKESGADASTIKNTDYPWLTLDAQEHPIIQTHMMLR